MAMSVAATGCREYCLTLSGDWKRCKVPWTLSGSFWVRSLHACVKLGIARFDARADASGVSVFKIPLVFVRSLVESRTADVLVSAAPPQYQNARHYVLRFHITLVGDPPPAPTATLPASSPPSEPIDMKELEKIVKTERLMQLHAQVQEMRMCKSPQLWRTRPFGESFASPPPRNYSDARRQQSLEKKTFFQTRPSA